MREIRKYNYPITKVFYKHVHIGDIENDQELLMFRSDMIANEEHHLYRLETPNRITVLIDKFGCTEYVEELEASNDYLINIREKQMSYRLEQK